MKHQVLWSQQKKITTTDADSTNYYVYEGADIVNLWGHMVII